MKELTKLKNPEKILKKNWAVKGKEDFSCDGFDPSDSHNSSFPFHRIPQTPPNI